MDKSKMSDNSISYAENCKAKGIEKTYNEDHKIHKGISQISTGEGRESNLETPLMFSRQSSLSSLSSIEGQSIRDDQSSIVSDFSPRPSGNVSPSLNQTKISDNVAQFQLSGNNNSSQKIQEKVQPDLCTAKKKVLLEEKTNITNTLFQYDIAFKKPHFFKHSVFEDDIAAFKDESSPNFLSTAASSLSSLTIDDEDYGDNALPNKAGLFKNKLNVTNKLLSEKTSVQEFWRRDPIGSAYESQASYPKPVSKDRPNNQQNILINKLDEKLSMTSNSNKNLHTISNQDQYKEQRRVDWTEHNVNGTQKYNQNLITNNNYKSRQNLSHEVKDNVNEFYFRTNSQIQPFQRDRIQSLQFNGKVITENRMESGTSNKYNGYEKFYQDEQEFNKQNRISSGFNKVYNETKYSISANESNDLNAYEEQLLDQCIRKGMAKVTKQNISDIKPFCWDLNQICLTTRAMFKIHGEDVRDRRSDFNKQCLLQRGSAKKMNNSKTK